MDTELFPDQLDLFITTYEPTVDIAVPIELTPDQLDLFITTYEPTVEAGFTTDLVPDQLDLVVETFAPTVDQSDHKLVTPSTRALIVNRFPAAVNMGAMLTPAAKALTVTTFAPSVSHGLSFVPTRLALSLATLAPSIAVSQNKFLTPGVRSLAVARFAPTVANSSPDFDFPVESQLSINPGVFVASQLSIVSPTIAAPTFAYGCHLSQGSVLLTWEHTEPDRLHHFDLYIAASLGGPYSLIARATTTRALIRNLPLGANLYFRVEAVGYNRSVSSVTQCFQGRLQNPVVPMSVTGIEGSVIPVGSIFSCVDTKNGSILAVQATERIEL